MTKNTLLILTFLCCSAWMVAQGTPDQTGGSTQPGGGQTGSQSGSQSPSGTGQTSSQSAGDMSGNTNGNQTTIQGFLMSSGGNYTITDASGTQYQLTGDTSKLSSHVNQQVQIKGSASGSASASASGNSGSAAGSSTSGSASASSPTSSEGTSGATGGAGSAQMFNVSKVKKISDSCSASR